MAWQLHGTCTPLILMSSRVIRVYHYTNMRVMAAAVSSCRLRCADNIARPLPGVLAYQPAGSPHIERVRLPYAAPCAFFVKVPGLVSPQRHTVQMCFCGMARSGGRSARPCFHASSGKGGFGYATLKVGIFAISLVSSRRRSSSSM